MNEVGQEEQWQNRTGLPRDMYQSNRAGGFPFRAPSRHRHYAGVARAALYQWQWLQTRRSLWFLTWFALSRSRDVTTWGVITKVYVSSWSRGNLPPVSSSK